MGFKKHLTLKCHLCKRKEALGGPKNTGSYKKSGWEAIWFGKNKQVGYLCPACFARRKAGAK